MMQNDPSIDIQGIIQTLVDGTPLTEDQARMTMDLIMTGQVTDAQIGALAIALRMKGETPDEIAGFARGMLDHAVQVHVDADERPLLDIVGTGGDRANTFNISTTAAFAIAASGVRIAKHGNRAVSSRCGAADLLEAFGVKIELTPDEVTRCVDEIGVGFMYAPAFHPALRFVGPARKQMGVRTIFNILGPLTNPAGTRHQLIGLGQPRIASDLANVYRKLGSQHLVLVHSEEGLDEIGISGDSYVTDWDARRGTIETYTVTPEDVGLPRGTRQDLVGGDAAENKQITLAVLNGEKGPRRNVVLMNAGAGIFAANATSSFAEGVAMAAEAIDSGRALKALEALIELTQAFEDKAVPA